MLSRSPPLKVRSEVFVNKQPQPQYFSNSSSEFLRECLTSLKDKTLEWFEQKMGVMLDSADDKLFDLADQSSEIAYFNAMRQMRIKRKGLVNTFKQELDFVIRKQCQIQDAIGKELANVRVMELDGLSLVQEDDLEEDLAIDGMVNKGRSSNQTTLGYLTTRLEVLVIEGSFEGKENPYDPRNIAEAFRTASHALELEIKSRLVVYKLFERNIIDELEELYDELNEFLASKDVLPNLHQRVVKKSEHKARKDSASESADNAVNREDIREEVFNTLRELLSDRKVSYAEGQQVVETPQLITALTQLQQDAGFMAVNMTDTAELKKVIGGFLPATKGLVNGGTIGQINDDVIDIITMLFDFLLDDKNLHNDIKALLARLQIPMLKVGLVDRNFFSDKHHSARKLLNELSRAGIGWAPNTGRDPLLEKMTEIVDGVTVTFKDDISIFEKLNKELQSFLENEDRRHVILENRMRQAEEGRARTESAKRNVNAEINRICSGRVIAEPVKLILKEAWTKVLFLESVKPDNQESWDKALKVAEFLIWSVQPKRDEQAKTKLRKVMTSLIKNIRLGMDKISFNTFRSSQLLQELEDCHRKLLEIPCQTAVKKDQPVASQHSVVEKAVHSLTTIVKPVTKADLEELQLPEEVSQTTDKEHPITQWVELLNEDDPIFGSVDTVQTGSWFEMNQVDEDPVRCKLAAHIVSADRYIFVNRSGAKLVEWNRAHFAAALKNEWLRLLDDAALFDRALASVITNLRAMKSA